LVRRAAMVRIRSGYSCGTGYLPDYLLCCLLDSGASG
ncbi:DNA transport, partial [Escherichia coli EC1865]